MNIKIRYNAPVTLTFTLVSVIILAIDQFLHADFISILFTVPGKGGFDASSSISYITLFTHIAGHTSWSHLLGNFAFILLLGPILEEKYGSFSLFIMLLITALATGILNILFFSTGLLGASGIVFMMILLASFTNIRNGEIPLSFILILVLYLFTEVINALKHDDISQFAHIIGGFCGSLFGFLRPGKR